MSLIKNIAESNNKLREESGEVTYSDPLTIFFYLLLRDALPAGKVEEIVRETVESTEECTFTNGWLAHYANSLAERVKGVEMESLKTALTKAFDKEKLEKEEPEETAEKAVKQVSESFDHDDFSLLEQKLIDAYEQQNNETSEEPNTNAAIEAVNAMVKKGIMSKQEAEDIIRDIEDAAKESVKENREEPEEVPPQEEKEKMTVDEAREMVDTAILDADKAAEEWSKDVHEGTDGYGPPVFTLQGMMEAYDKEMEILKNGKKVDGEWEKEHTTMIDTDATIEDIEKWKKTHEELEKIDKELEALKETADYDATVSNHGAGDEE